MRIVFRRLLCTVLVIVSCGTVALAAKPGDALPAFSYDVEGVQMSVTDLQGQVVYIDFWASWCLPCRQSFPWMSEMHRRFAGGGLVILSINLDQEPELADVFL